VRGRIGAVPAILQLQLQLERVLADQPLASRVALGKLEYGGADDARARSDLRRNVGKYSSPFTTSFADGGVPGRRSVCVVS